MFLKTKSLVYGLFTLILLICCGLLLIISGDIVFSFFSENETCESLYNKGIDIRYLDSGLDQIYN